MSRISDSDLRVYVALLMEVFFMASLIVMLALPAMLNSMLLTSANAGIIDGGNLFDISAGLYRLYCYLVGLLPFIAVFQAAPEGGIIPGVL